MDAYTGVAKTSGNLKEESGVGGRIKYNGGADGRGLTDGSKDDDDEEETSGFVTFNVVISTLSGTEAGENGRPGEETEEDKDDE